MNLQQHRMFTAIDQAWDSGFTQTTATMARMVKDLSEIGDDTQAIEVARKWGMTHLIAPEKDPKSGKPTGKEILNIPTFFGITLSLARSTLLMRISKIVNERLGVPFMKFDPAWTTDDRLLFSEIITQRIETGNREFGYSQVFGDGVQMAAKYGQQLQLIVEEWFSEMDELDDGPRVGKEGLRYQLPHPSRSYWDLDWPTWTFNTNSGTRFVGFWQITTVGSIRAKDFWNKERITRAEMFGDPKWQAFFQTTGSCRMTAGSNTNWFSRLDRERVIDSGTSWFASAADDQPVWITNHFEKFNPRVEFGDDKMPDTDIWFRIVLASDDTPIYVTALVDRPGIMWLYEPIGTHSFQQGLMLELLPFQDHASNLLAQGILSAKQNLANITLFDKDAIDPAHVRRDLENPGERLFRKLNFWEFSGKKLLRQQTSVDALFKSYRFPQLDVATHLRLLSELVGLMRNVVGMSDQEVGSAASHEQSAEEIRAIHTATSHRFEYVASWFDFVFECWKRQLYTYYTQYSTAPAYAYLSAENFERVRAAGFEMLPDRKGNIMVKAPMSALRVEHFVAQRDGPNRIPWTTIGGQMLTFLQGFMASPLAQTMPPESTIKMVNQALEALQFPKSFRIPPIPTAAGQIPAVMQQWVAAQLEGLANQVKVFVSQQVQQQGEKDASDLSKGLEKLRAYVDGRLETPAAVTIHQNQAPGSSSAS